MERGFADEAPANQKGATMNEPSSTNPLKDTAVSRLRRLRLRSLGGLCAAVLTAGVLVPAAAPSTASAFPGRGWPRTPVPPGQPFAPQGEPPVIALVQVQSQLSALAATADAPGQAALDDAVTQLGNAFPDNASGPPSLSSLWADINDENVPVPPPYGDAVFTSTEAAVTDLVNVLSDRTVSRSALDAAGDEVLDADQSITDNALAQAGVGYPPFSPPFGPGAAVQIATDESQWQSAYQRLGNQVTAEVTSLPQGTLDQAGAYLLETPIESLDFNATAATGPELTSGGLPEVFYFGAEGCPYCGVDRWSLVIALAQFGTFSPLALSVSGTVNDYTGTSTFSFYGAGYTSRYLAFVPVEGWTNQPSTSASSGPGGDCTGYPWSPLQDLTPGQLALVDQYDDNCNFVPFLDVANRWTTTGPYPDPQIIQGMSWQQIVGALGNPGSAVARSIEGGAVYLVAQICNVTGNQPASVCNAAAVQQWEATLP